MSTNTVLPDTFAGKHHRLARASAVSLCLSAAVLSGCSPAKPAHGSGSPGSGSPSAQQMVHVLEALLPEGRLSGQRGQGLGSGSAAPSAALVYGRDGNQAKVSVSLYRWGLPVPSLVLQCPDTAYAPFSRCTETRLPDGGRLTMDRSPEDGSEPSGVEVLTAQFTYGGGEQVVVKQTETRPGQWAADEDASLPLAGEQLSAVATSPRWKPVLSRMPKPPDTERTESSPGVAGKEIARTLAVLLPAGLRARRPAGAEGFGHVVVDDGRGESLVAANVQRWKPGDDRMAKVFEKSTTLPDGTRVRSAKEPSAHGGKGAVEWSVDILRDDGLRVVVMAVNARGYGVSASRTEPALTLRQLRRIALDRTWRDVAG
ncbi:hypothetical protein PV355_06645 [Streptomyces stelliscabiei]|nr:hypothetical protein [Streptomyces stelliscabiei]SOD77704.1 hypothetical protein SAMN06272781_5594 [Streptomyces sp. 1222.2]